jgi:hypothetical protein
MLMALPLLAACSPAAEETVVNESQAPAAQQEPAAVPDLAGEWDVVAINSGPLDQIFDMNATATDDRLTVRSDCVSMSWSYVQDRNMVSFTPASVVNCPRGRTRNEDQVEGAIGRANIAMFADEGREVQLSGAGGTVTMTRR